MPRLTGIIILILISSRLSGQTDCTIYGYPEDSTVCYGNPVYLFTNFSDTLNYHWEPGGLSGVIIEVILTGPVTYVLYVYNNDSSYFCTDSIDLDIKPYLELKISHTPSQILANEEATFSFEAANGDPGLLAHWEWDINGHLYYDELNPVYTFQEPGSYYAGLTYETSNDCRFSIYEDFDVSVYSVDELSAGDFVVGPNPSRGMVSFNFYLERSSAVSLTVYDLTGRMVFSLNDASLPHGPQQINWDAAGSKQGIYFYRLSTEKQIYSGRVVVK